MKCRRCRADLFHTDPIPWAVCPNCQTENLVVSPETCSEGPSPTGLAEHHSEQSTDRCESDGSSRSFPKAQPVNQQGEYACPDCRVKMATAILGSDPVELCLSCGGILLDGDVFLQVVNDRRQRPNPETDAFADSLQESRTERCRCPDCNQTMQAHPACGTGNRQVDACRHCRLVWVVRGNLASLNRTIAWEHAETESHLMFQAKSLVPLPPTVDDFMYRFFP